MAAFAPLAAGVVEGGIDLLTANAQQKATLADQQAAAAAANQNQQNAFNQQLGYINSSNAAQRTAIEGETNPEIAAAASLPRPTAQALPGQANMGGQVYGGGSGTPLGLATAQPPQGGAAPMPTTRSASAMTSQPAPQFGPAGQAGTPQQQPTQMNPNMLRQLLAQRQQQPQTGLAPRYQPPAQSINYGALASLPPQYRSAPPGPRNAQAQ